MRQRNEIERERLSFDQEFTTNYRMEFLEHDEFADREFPDWNDQLRTQDFQFIVHPRGTIGDFVTRRHTIGATGAFAGETSDNSREVDSGTHHRFIHAAPLFEPAKQSFAGGMRKRPLQHRLAHPRSLTDEDDFAEDCST
jgi:hypothetical protein